jgi:hypothetical protein
MKAAAVLVVTLCLVSDPKACHDATLTPLDYLGHPVDIMGCMLAAQPLAAEMVAGRPQFFIRKIRCEPEGKDA